MNHKCRNIDITDKQFVVQSIHDCNGHKSSKKMSRDDIARLYSQYPTVDSVSDVLTKEMQEEHLDIRQVRYEERVDRSNGKLRIIAIEDIKQQYYDYIAYNGLSDLDSYIGHYQIACRRGMGPLFGAKVIQQWMKDHKVRYAIKADVKKCYPSITHKNMMAWLNKHVANDRLLWLINALLEQSENGVPTATLRKRMLDDPETSKQVELVRQGLPIGSYLSIKLCALYMADLYHRCEGSYFTSRRGKRENVFRHVMFNLDDIYLFGSSAKDMHRAMVDLTEFAETKGLTIKPNWQIISLSHKDPNAHIDVLGYRVYRDRITMRRRNYCKLRRSVSQFNAHKTVSNARSFLARYGMFVIHTNSRRFCSKYAVYAAARRARKVVSKYDKGNVRRKAGPGNRNSDRGGQLLPDLPA